MNFELKLKKMMKPQSVLSSDSVSRGIGWMDRNTGRPRVKNYSSPCSQGPVMATVKPGVCTLTNIHFPLGLKPAPAHS